MDIKSQQARAEAIVKAYNNFKKDSSSRKTEKYLKDHIQTLEELWTEFSEADQVLSKDLTSSYVVTEYTSKVEKTYEEYKGILQELLSKIPKDNTSSAESTANNETKVTQPIMATVVKLQRQFAFKKASLKQQINSTLENGDNATPAYVTHKIKQLE